jgi:hypothetical protein
MEDILNLIFNYEPNYYCLLTCKNWYNIIMKHVVICNECHKIIKMYDQNLWITDVDDNLCHGYYGDLEKYKILKEMIKKDLRFFSKIKRLSLGLWLEGVYSTSYICFPMKIKPLYNDWYINALDADGRYIKFIDNPTYKLCYRAIRNTPEALQYIPEKYQTEELCMKAILKELHALKYVINQNEQFILKVNKQYTILFSIYNCRKY